MTTSTSAAASTELSGGVRAIAETHDGVGAEFGEFSQSLRIASGGDDVTCAQPLGDLHGHLAGATRSTENQHRLAGLKVVRRRSATHDDIAGFIAAATSTGSVPSGNTKLWRRSITVCSAIAPDVVSPSAK